LNYSRTNEFVSRACGFKTTYTLDPITPLHTDAPTPDLKWISAIAVKNSIINNENENTPEIFLPLFDFLFYCALAKEN
jgi:hypothetical protein